MDCPSEENMIRMKLDGIPFKKLEFDITNRNLFVFHEGAVDPIYAALIELNLGASLTYSEESFEKLDQADHTKEKNLLWTVLIINFGFFVIEIITGFFSRSMGLVADSLDMFADAIVYGLSLYAVGHIAAKKKESCQIKRIFSVWTCYFRFWRGLTEISWL